ncbi:MAG: head GIN domain-containing protein [Bacteroidota bacterium]
MKISNWIQLAVLCLLMSTSACYFDDDDGGLFNCEKGEGDIVSQELTLNEFYGIELKIDADVYLVQGAKQKVLVEGQENIVDLIELDIQDDIWEIEFDDCVRNYDQLKIFVTLPDVDKLSLSGSGKIESEGLLTTEFLELRVSGSGDMNLELDAIELEARIAGSGEMQLEGVVDKADLSISGSGDFEAFGMETGQMEINISGSGDADVNVADQLDIKISGSGDVRYKGFPVINVDISGSGDVRDAN